MQPPLNIAAYKLYSLFKFCIFGLFIWVMISSFHEQKCSHPFLLSKSEFLPEGYEMQ